MSKIINQTKVYIWGELYIIDIYEDFTCGYADCIFANTIDELVTILKGTEGMEE